jgi:hypothetical protein
MAIEGDDTMTESIGRTSKSLFLEAPISGHTILTLGRDGADDALQELRRYSPEQLSRALQELTPVQRVEFLETAERVDEIVPLLPEAEFTRTVRGYGIEESGWLVEFASPDQRIAAVDLDCWRDFRFSPSRFFEWIDAMIEAGPETLADCLSELDSELWTLAMRAMGNFEIVGMGSHDGHADSCGGGMTIDGVVYYDAFSANDENRIREILSAAFQFAPTRYWSLVYGAISKGDPESNEYAVRWRRNRLGDLGFPEREQAMRAYAPLSTHALPAVDPEGASEGTPIAIGLGRAAARIEENLLGQTLAELSSERGNDVMNSILAVANSIAVADRLPLTEDATAERSLAKAVRGIEQGLAEVSRTQNRPLGAVLDKTPPLDLFRIGTTLDASLRPRDPCEASFVRDEEEDWNVETEMIAEEDEVVANLSVRRGSQDTD